MRGKKPRWYKEPALKRLFHHHTSLYPANREQHFEFLGQLLRRTLLRRDYCGAYKIYNGLVTSTPVSEEFVWKIGCELLRQKEDYESACIRFLQLLFIKSREYRQSILLETALYQLRFGKLEDAHATLEPYVETDPYIKNSVLQGYAGVIEFALWIKLIREEQRLGSNQQDDGSNHEDQLDDDKSNDDDWLEEGDERRLDSKISRHKRAAEKFLERALELDNQNDMFLTYLVRSKCGRIEFSGLGSKTISRARKAAIYEMKNYLKRFYNSNNSSLLALRLLAALENREVQQTLELILKHDPVADLELYVQPLLKLMIQGLPKDVHSEVMGDPLALGARRRTPPSSSRPGKTPLHGMDVRCLHPILHILLTRAEYGDLTGWEKQMIVRICDLVCCCSTCRQANNQVDQQRRSYFDTLPPRMQPSWYRKLAMVLYRQ
ncbi:MAG: hypothetical protein J3Q66DRAFT_332926 [Benniella sp.]|nr:MAG: hypothetical protein J3Q66DRAFT_332926 [Benniella sp.]